MQTQNCEKNISYNSIPIVSLKKIIAFLFLYPVAETGFHRNMTCSWFYDRLDD